MALKQDLKRVQEESRTSATSATPFQTLKSLDTIKTNLEKCVNVLQETGNWNSLVREMESHFASRNLGEVAARLAVMRQSLATLENFPDAAKRADMMERMEQRLEALVRPGLQNALEQVASGEKEPLKQSVIVYGRLGRRQALLADLGQARGRACFDKCWNEDRTGVENNDKYFYTRFLDRVLVHLREVETPICQYCFESPANIAEALAFIVRYCFENVTAELLVTSLRGSKPASKDGKQMDVEGCSRYILAHVGMERFKKDVASSIFTALDKTSEPLEKSLVAISKPFAQLDQQYLEWESSALLLAMKEASAEQQKKPSEDEGSDALDEILGPSGWEQRLSDLEADDYLERLSEECAARCTQIGLGAQSPVARMFQAHAQECFKFFREARKAHHATRDIHFLKLCASLKTRFLTVLRRIAPQTTESNLSAESASNNNNNSGVTSSPARTSPRVRLQSSAATSSALTGENVLVKEDASVVETKNTLNGLLDEAKSLLYASLIGPALELLDKVMEVNKESAGGHSSLAMPSSSESPPSDAITKTVDHLYSLIPLLEFEQATVDLIADPMVLCKTERSELEAIVGASILYNDPQSHTITVTGGGAGIEENEDLARTVSASWLETVARGLSTGFVLRTVKQKKVSDRAAAQLKSDADCLEKNIGSIFAQGVLWDPALGVCRVVLSAGPGLTHLKLGNPAQHLDERYYLDLNGSDALKSLEHVLVALRNRA